MKMSNAESQDRPNTPATSVSMAVVFIVAFIVGVLSAYFVLSPFVLGLMQLSLDRFGTPLSEGAVRILRIAISLFTGVIAAVTAVRVKSSSFGEQS